MTIVASPLPPAPIEQGAPALPQFILTATDRCDHCGARAYHRVTMISDAHLDLQFCNHHAEKHREKITPLVFAWLDESAQLQGENRLKD